VTTPDQIADRAARGPGFDVSPRGIAPRPDPELEALLTGLDDKSVPALRERLEVETDPFLALTWLRALLAIGTPAAREAVDAYATRLHSEDPWQGGFPGARELLLYLGR
jgi:hypothetical protein